MLDTIIHRHETTVTPVTRVVEKTITPDKVTDMYDNVREQMEKDFLGAFKLESNDFTGLVVLFEEQFHSNYLEYFGQFKINGKEHTIKKTVRRETILMNTVEVVYEELFDAYKSELTKLIVLETAKIQNL